MDRTEDSDSPMDQEMSRRSVLESSAFGVGGLGLASGDITGTPVEVGPPQDLPSGGDDQTEQRDMVFIANSKGGTVSIVDAEEFEVLREIDILPDGAQADPTSDPVQGTAGQRVVEATAGENYAQDLNVSPDGRTLYVSRGHRGDVAAFDIESGDLLWKTPVNGFRSDHMTLYPDGSRLFVSAISGRPDEGVDVVETESGEIVGRFQTGEFPHDNTVSPDGEYVYNSSIGNILQPREVRENRPKEVNDTLLRKPYQITVADAETLEVVDTHEFDRGIRPSEVVWDEGVMYAQLSFFHGFIEYDFERRRNRRTVHLPLSEEAKQMDESEYPFEAPHHGLAMSPDEDLICVAGRVSNYAAIVRRSDLKEVAIINVGESPGWAANTPDGSHCVITSEVANTASFISYESKDEVARIDLGEVPKYSLGARVPEEII